MDIATTKQKLTEISQELTRYHIPKLLNELFPKARVAELGVYTGAGIDLLLSADVEKVVAVDLWKGNGKITVTDGLSDEALEKHYQDVSKKFKDNPLVHIIRQDSFIAAEQFPDNHFDFVFIDDDHSYNGCMDAMMAWYPKVKDGGILAGHDYMAHTSAYKFGVVEAVNDFVEQNKEIDRIFVSTEAFAPSWFMVKVPLKKMNCQRKQTLAQLAEFYGTDKHLHKYLDFYQKNLPTHINKILEIGVGKGESLRMWRAYYPDAKIFAIDSESKKEYEFRNCKTFVANQTNIENIRQHLDLKEKFDVIIDDGGHYMAEQQISLSLLLPHAKYYIVENLHTSLPPLKETYGDGSSLPFLVGIKPTSDHMSIQQNATILNLIDSVTVLRNVRGIGHESLTSIIKTKIA